MKSNKKMLTLLMSAVMCMSTLSFTSCGSKKLQHVDAVDATCTTDGHSEYYTDGSKYFSDENGKTEVDYADLIIAAKGHTEKTDWATSDTQHWHDCSVCGKPATDKGSHVFGDWVYDVPPTASAPGEGHKECETCDYKTVKETVPPTGGGGTEVTLTRVPPRDSTCKIPGNIEYWTDGTKCYSDKDGKNEISRESTLKQLLPHTPESEWHKTDPDLHWHDCSVCGDPADEKQPHSLGDWVVEQGGVNRHKECGTCHYVTPSTPVPAPGTITPHAAVGSTCSTKGNSAYWEKDGKYYDDAACTHEIALNSWILDFDANNHEGTTEYDKTETQHTAKCSACHTATAVAANHEWGNWIADTGNKRHHVCNVCGYSSTPEDAPVYHAAVASTCHTHGSDEYWSYKGNNYNDANCTVQFTGSLEKPFDSSNHDGAEEWGKDADRHWHKCLGCNNSKGDEAAHSFGNWVVDTQPTTEPGSQHRDCTECKYRQTAEISANTTHHAAVAPTCTEAGTVEYWEKDGKKYSDAACNNEITDITGDAALGHDWDTEDSVYEDGKFYKVCKRDGEHKEEVAAYADRTVKVNDVDYTPFTCYDSDHIGNGVTYNAIKQLFVIDPGKFADGLTIAGNNNEVAIKTETDIAVENVTFTNGFRTLKIIGDGILTVNGNFSTEANSTDIDGRLNIVGSFMGGAVTNVTGNLTAGLLNCDDNKTLNVNGGSVVIKGESKSTTVNVIDGDMSVYGLMTVANLTVGDANGEKNPTVNIKTAPGANGLTNGGLWLAPGADYKILSGTLTIQQSTVSGTGIDFTDVSTDKTNKLIVGTHGTVNIKGFINGTYSNNSSAIVEIMGNVNIITKNFANDWGLEATGFNRTNLNVKGGNLVIYAECWGMTSGSVNFESGSAIMLRESVGYAPFNSVSQISIAAGFDFQIKNFDILLYGVTDGSGINVATSIITENVPNFNNGKPSNATVAEPQQGTVTTQKPDIPDIPDIA